MSLSDAAAEVLRSILSIGGDTAVALEKKQIPTPGAVELYAFSEMLAEVPGEETLQRFLEAHPGFISGLLGGPDNADLAILFKPPLGARFRSDFCFLQAGQGGGVIHLVEIERSTERLYTRGGRVSQPLSQGLKQLSDWRIWVTREKDHFSREIVSMAKKLPLLGDNPTEGKGFRLRSPEDVESHWRAFGGFEAPQFTFNVIIGRWSQLSTDDKRRVLDHNRQPGGTRIFTHEQVARTANIRHELQDW